MTDYIIKERGEEIISLHKEETKANSEKTESEEIKEETKAKESPSESTDEKESVKEETKEEPTTDFTEVDFDDLGKEEEE